MYTAYNKHLSWP